MQWIWLRFARQTTDGERWALTQMSDERMAVSWFNSLPLAERVSHIVDLWQVNGEPQPRPKKEHRPSKPKFDFDTIKELAYKSKRGISSKSDRTKFMVLFEIYGETSEFKRACLHGQAQAISEFPFQGTFEEILKQLSR